MAAYAESTTITADKSRSEIERTLTRYSATSFMYGWSNGQAVLAFTAKGRQVRFLLPMPDRTERRFTHTPGKGIRRSAEAAGREYDQAVRQRWRALALVVKAKLEAVESGITSFEDEFLAHTVLPGGQTVSEKISDQVQDAYDTGQITGLLPDYSRLALEESS